jgi:phage/plasmid-associated DNA primase
MTNHHNEPAFVSKKPHREAGEDVTDTVESEAGVYVVGRPEGRTTPRDGGIQRLEEAHLGEMIAENQLKGKFLYAKGFGWMGFDGRRWTPGAETAVAEVIRRTLIEFHRSEAESGVEPGRLQQISRSLSANKIRALVYIARLRLMSEQHFDSHPDLLNVANGVVDLRTGELRPHDPELMFTKLAPVNYERGARHKDWEQALEAVPKDAVYWLELRLGQGITGHPVPDDRLVVFKGSGSNGKTTIVDGVREALGGDYAVTMPDRVLLARQGDHPTELMMLRGARVALMEELPELGHLNVKRLKDLLGTGEMNARHIAKDTVSWKPTHTPIVTTNYLPRVDESDDGTWRQRRPRRERPPSRSTASGHRPGPSPAYPDARGSGMPTHRAWTGLRELSTQAQTIED